MRTEDITDSVEKVKAFLEKIGCKAAITHTDATIFTADDASRAVGVPSEEILKSMLFTVDDGGTPSEGPRWILALMSGANRVSDKKVKQAAGVRRVKMGSPEAIAAFSGFAPGGVPPVGYPAQPRTLLDEDLFRYDVVWAAAGTDHDFFPISPAELLRITGGERADIKKSE